MNFLKHLPAIQLGTVLAIATFAAQAGDWTHFRGTAGDGSAVTTKLPAAAGAASAPAAGASAAASRKAV